MDEATKPKNVKSQALHKFELKKTTIELFARKIRKLLHFSQNNALLYPSEKTRDNLIDVASNSNGK